MSYAGKPPEGYDPDLRMPSQGETSQLEVVTDVRLNHPAGIVVTRQLLTIKDGLIVALGEPREEAVESVGPPR